MLNAVKPTFSKVLLRYGSGTAVRYGQIYISQEVSLRGKKFYYFCCLSPISEGVSLWWSVTVLFKFVKGEKLDILQF